MFTALKTKNSLQSPESLGAFVNSISNNVLMELYRKHSRTRSVEYDEQYDSPDGRSTAESEMVSEERRQEVRNSSTSCPTTTGDCSGWFFLKRRISMKSAVLFG